MTSLPSLPLYIDAYEADTRHLTDAEHGRYLKLLMLMWRSPKCHVPNEDKWLASRLNCTPAKIRRDYRPIIDQYCIVLPTSIAQKRLLSEWTKAQERRIKSASAARTRWDENSAELRGNGHADAYAHDDAHDDAQTMSEQMPGDMLDGCSEDAQAYASSSSSISNNQESKQQHSTIPARARSAPRDHQTSGLRLLCDCLGLEPTPARQRELDTLAGEGFDYHQHLLPAAREAERRGGTRKTLNYLRRRAGELRNAKGTASEFSPPEIEHTDADGWAKRMAVCVALAKREDSKPVDVWNDHWGPPPGAPGCLVPAAVAKKLMPQWDAFEAST